MNYLAHAFLSLNQDDIQVGNLMGDFVKGNKYLLYPNKIKQGILLHRSIDSYTDQHPLIHEAIRFFKPDFRLSGGVFVDILFDHFLANDPRYFDEDELKAFTATVYKNLKHHEWRFDDKMKNFFFHMASYDWLYQYKYQEGLKRSIRGICKRHPVLGDSENVLNLVSQHYEALHQLFVQFFPELHQHVNQMEFID